MKSLQNIAIGIFFITTLVYAYLYYHVLGSKVSLSPLPDMSDAREVPVTRYTDSAGIEHVTYNTVANEVIRKEAIRKSATLQPYIDSIALALSIKSKQVESTTTITLNTTGTQIAFLKHTIDSLKRQIYNYKDKYLSLTVRAPIDSADKGEFDFAYDADLNINQYWKRKKILGLPLGSRVSYTDISSNDKRTMISGVKTLTIKQKQPSFGLRGQIRTSYMPSLSSFLIGPALRFDINNISIGTTLYYNFSDNKFRPNITADYTVF